MKTDIEAAGGGAIAIAGDSSQERQVGQPSP